MPFSTPSLASPIWQPPGSLGISSALQPWVLDGGSLTRRLKRHGHFRVQLLHQALETPTEEERRLLQLPSRSLTLIREVALSVNDQPVVLARSVLPVSSLRGANRVLGHMLNRSLGAELFRRPAAQRTRFWLSHLPLSDLPFSASSHNQLKLVSARDNVTGRLSLFLKRQQPLLVAEFFLPALTRLPNPNGPC